MSDYIKREDALNAFSNAFYSGLAAKIKEIPSADVAPVQHGRWIYPLEYSAYCNCSLCGFETVSYDAWKYCPNCGAKMYGEDND